MKSFMRFSQLLAVLLVGGVFALPASATPVTFQFEAVVGPPRAGFEDDIGLPFSFAEDDMISGQFTFEPLDVPSDVIRTDVVQGLDIEFTVDGFTFKTDRFLLSVDDNLSGGDAPIPTDVIRLQRGFCSSTECERQTVEGQGSPEFGFSVSFFGTESTLSGADIPADLAVWSSFDFAKNSSLILSFRDDSRSKFDGLLAYVVSVKAVPEPSTLSTLGFVVIAWIGRSRRLCRNSNNYIQ